MRKIILAATCSAIVSGVLSTPAAAQIPGTVNANCTGSSPFAARAPFTADAWETLVRSTNSFWVSDDFVSTGSGHYLLSLSAQNSGSMKIEFVVGGAVRETIVLRPTAKPLVLDADYRDHLLMVSERSTEILWSNDGAFTSGWVPVMEDKKARTATLTRLQFKIDQAGNLLYARENGSNQSKPDFSWHITFKPCSAEEFSRIAAATAGAYDTWNRTELPKLVAKAEAERQARLEAEKAKSADNGLMGALIGAAVGVYAGTSAGLNTSDTVGLMMQGAAAASPDNPIAQAAASGWAEEAANQEALQHSMRKALSGDSTYSSAPLPEGSTGRTTSGLLIEDSSEPSAEQGPQSGQGSEHLDVSGATKTATLNQPEKRSETSSLPSAEKDRIYQVRSNMFTDQQRARDWLMSLPGASEFFDVRCDPIVVASGKTQWICSASQRRRGPGGSGSAQ